MIEFPAGPEILTNAGALPIKQPIATDPSKKKIINIF